MDQKRDQQAAFPLAYRARDAVRRWWEATHGSVDELLARAWGAFGQPGLFDPWSADPAVGLFPGWAIGTWQQDRQASLATELLGDETSAPEPEVATYLRGLVASRTSVFQVVAGGRDDWVIMDDLLVERGIAVHWRGMGWLSHGMSVLMRPVWDGTTWHVDGFARRVFAPRHLPAIREGLQHVSVPAMAHALAETRRVRSLIDRWRTHMHHDAARDLLEPGHRHWFGEVYSKVP